MTETHRPILEIVRQYGHAVYREAMVTAAGMSELTLAYDHKQGDLLKELQAAVDALSAPPAPVAPEPLPVVLTDDQRRILMGYADVYGGLRFDRGYAVGKNGGRPIVNNGDLDARRELVDLLAKPLSSW